MATLILVPCLGRAQAVYSTNFEPDSQGAAFSPGPIEGQGSPAWAGCYASGYDVAGKVDDTESYGNGTQSMRVAGYQTSRLELNEPVVNQWFEFAFRPNFKDGIPGTAFALTTRGAKDDIVGISVGLEWDGEKGRILLNVYVPTGEGGWASEGTEIGTFTNEKWQTISFRANNSKGTYEVFLGKDPIGSFQPSQGHFNGIKTIVFSTATGNWEQTGDWNIDAIHVGEEPVHAFQ